uniref:Glycoside hydrolase family 19 catalytic domain-containing protein n=1 Tax=Chenopodium quinoa TaxID=63459 RepID=A0A803MD63_CHEQI
MDIAEAQPNTAAKGADKVLVTLQEEEVLLHRNAFLNALNSYPQFGTGGSSDVTKREVAAFFAHVTQETGSFCYIEEIAKSTYCKPSEAWPCNPSKQYYGRGPLQLTWNYNYGAVGRSIGFDGINAPETVANNPVTAFN